jgi:hypothetical protein
MPNFPNSRPTPDILNPPRGLGVTTMGRTIEVVSRNVQILRVNEAEACRDFGPRTTAHTHNILRRRLLVLVSDTGSLSRLPLDRFLIFT